MKISVDIAIERPKSKVWQAITDIENCPNMISAIIDLKILHQPEKGLTGLKWQETRKIFGKESSEIMWITDFEENSYYQTRAENHGAVYISTLSLNETPTGCILTMTFSGGAQSFFVKLISSIMSIFIKGSMVRMLKDDLKDIKDFVEEND